MTGLRDYQAEAIDATREAVHAGARAPLIVCPTGGGKTKIAATISRRHISRGGRVLWLAHRSELVQQAASRLVADGVPSLRVIQAGRCIGDDGALTVASIQTLRAKTWRDRLPPATLVVFDEAHHYVADEWGEIANHYAAALRIGLTATPERGDGTPLGDLFDHLVSVSSVRALIDQGHLVPCIVYAPEDYRAQLSATPLEAYRAHGEGRTAIVFCSNVNHAEETAAQFSAAGIPSASLDGKTARGKRAALLEQHRAGAIRVLTNVAVLTEGYDDPGVSVCILARGCEHTGTFLQIVGRVLRPATNKTHAVLIDLRGAVHRHGLPEMDREYSLDGEAIRAAGRLSPLKQCRRCGAVFAPVRVCPMCGAVGPVPESPEVRRARLEAIYASHSEDKRAEFLRWLRKEAAERGYHHAWVGHRYRARYGQMPPAVPIQQVANG